MGKQLKQSKSYKEQVIIQKDPIDAIRSRSGMYVGSLENANVLLREIIDNSLDEITSDKSPADTVWIYTFKDKYVVCDNGRGLPLQKSINDNKETMAVQSCTSLHAGSKFEKDESIIGLNGIGSTAVNALSAFYEFFVKINKNKLENTTKRLENICNNSSIPIKDSWYYCRFEKGRIKEETVVNTQWIKEHLNINISNKITNIVSFDPDTTIYESREAEIPGSLKFIKYISSHNETMAKIYINDEEYKDFFKPFEFEFDVTVNSLKQESKNPSARFLCSFEIDKKNCDNPVYISSINGLVSSGVHTKLFDLAFDLSVGKIYGEEYIKFFKRGLMFSVVTLCPEPEFNSQTKTTCSGIPGIDKKCIEPLVKKITKIFKDNKEAFELHFERIKKIMASQQNLGKIEYIKEKIGGILAENPKGVNKLPRCVIDCYGKNREKCTMYIVEGRSAAGNFLASRDPKTDAIVQMRGKLLNTSDMDIKKALNNEEIRGILQAIGTGTDDYYDLSKVRYGKIVIACDSDADGVQITSIVLGLFMKHCSYLIKNKMVYILETPLYRQDNKFFYAGEEDLLDPDKTTIHYKGLGEWNAKDFKAVCMNKDRREVLVTMDNIDQALEYLSTSKKKNELMIEEKIILF